MRFLVRLLNYFREWKERLSMNYGTYRKAWEPVELPAGYREPTAVLKTKTPQTTTVTTTEVKSKALAKFQSGKRMPIEFFSDMIEIKQSGGSRKQMRGKAEKAICALLTELGYGAGAEVYKDM